MDFEKQTPDEIVENAENAQEGEIADDEAEAVAGGRSTKAMAGHTERKLPDPLPNQAPRLQWYAPVDTNR